MTKCWIESVSTRLSPTKEFRDLSKWTSQSRTSLQHNPILSTTGRTVYATYSCGLALKESGAHKQERGSIIKYVEWFLSTHPKAISKTGSSASYAQAENNTYSTTNLFLFYCVYIYILLTSPCHGRQSILPPCNMGFQTLLMIAHLLHLIFIASPKNVGPSWVAFPRSRTRAQTSMILSSWSTQFAISMNTTSGEDTLVSFNYHQHTEPAYYGVYMYIYIYTYTLVCSKPLQFSQIHETTSGRAQFSGLEAPGRGCLRRGAGAEAHPSLGGWSIREWTTGDSMVNWLVVSNIFYFP